VNYIEGQVSVNGTPLNRQQVGQAALQAGEVLDTGNGKAEVLLSPGVFVRTGSNSGIRMVSPELVDPRVEVTHGEVMVEVDQKLKDQRVDVLEHGADTALLKPGLYRFRADAGTVEVIDGKAQVTENDHSKEIGKGKEVALEGPSMLKPASFDRKAEDDLYAWSNIRSNYLAEVNASTARYIYMGYGPYWGPGWYWNPWFAAWSWMPGDGFFYSPFGYPFFSPRYVVYAPRFGVVRGAAVARNTFPGGQAIVPRGPLPQSQAFAARGFAGGGAFQGHAFAARGFAGGGFHGGGRR
jgi:hypothetical protein